jgi:hypothetical protein
LFIQTHFQKILLAVLLIALAPYIYLSFFASPAADDYCFSFMAKNAGFWNLYVSHYCEWNGRYISNFLIFANPLISGNFTLYKYASVIQIIFSLACIYYFLRSITKRFFRPLTILNASLILLLLYFFMLPSLAEEIYWYTGAVTYQTGICFTILYFGLLSNYFEERYFLNKRAHFLLSATAVIIAAGFNEVLTLLLAAFHLAVLYLYFYLKKKIENEWWILFASCSAGILIMFLSPGNSIRFSIFLEHHNVLHSAFFTFMQSVRFAFDWISNLPFIFLSLLLFFIVSRNKNYFLHFVNFNPFRPVFILFFFSLIFFLCIFPPYWETNILGQHRTVNTACFFFILYSFVIIISVALKFGETVQILWMENFKIKTAILAFVICAMATSKNGYIIFTDILYGNAKQFHKEMNARNETLKRNSDTNNIVYFKPLSVKPKSLFVVDISGDAADWINICQAEYFRTRAIVCKE